jgi:uncharacterized protein YbjT (DUF2867 family)
LDRLVAGADTIVVIPPSGRHPLPTTTRLLEAAVLAGSGHVVFVSTFGAELRPGFAFGRWALEGEHAVAAGGIPFTVLRPNSYMTNFLGMLRPDAGGALRLPWRDGRTSFVDPDDVADVAVSVVREPDRHRGATYEVTGPQALDGHDVAAALSHATGGSIDFVDTPMTAVREQLARSGMPPAMVDAFVELHDVMASGARARTTDDVGRILDRPPRSLAAFLADHASAPAIVARP